MIKKTLFSSLLVLTVITLCVAAALDGIWVGTMKTPDGEQFPITYQFKSEGDKLTGSIDIPDNTLTIESGKITGKTFTFNANFNGESYPHEGTFMEDSIKVKVQFGSSVVENVLKRKSN